MGFKKRLTMFFIGIVLIPMIVLGLLVREVSDDSRDGKADARLSTSLETAKGIYDRALRSAAREAERIAAAPIGESGSIATAVGAADADALQAVARRELEAPGIAAVSFYGTGGERIVRAGIDGAIASARRTLVGAGGTRIGLVEVAVFDPTAFAAKVGRLTGAEVAVVSDEGTLAATPALAGPAIPAAGGEAASIDLPGGEGRAAALALDGAPEGARLVLATEIEESWLASSPILIGGLIAFLIVALAGVAVIIRELQRQIASMLAAARRIGSGDFSHPVPVEGRDEIAALAREFNKMSDRLAGQMAELTRQREELDRSVRRLGTAFAAGLDREALLEIVVETAIASCGAETGRVSMLDQIEPLATAGPAPDERLADALERASRASLDSRGLSDAPGAGAQAIAIPLSPPGEQHTVLGTMSVARHGEPFSDGERDVFRYLVGQAEVSIHNIGAHERIVEQSVTDDLTGLSNSRHFREWMSREIARANRFGGELSLVICDVDDFKAINDTRGHLQGDAVLEMIGRVLRMESRGIDEPARYGGEEFVLGLPETPSVGAVEVAERVRARLEETLVEAVNGGGPVRITASLGVATMPADGTDLQSLIAAADEALYAAKRAGKNRVMTAART